MANAATRCECLSERDLPISRGARRATSLPIARRLRHGLPTNPSDMDGLRGHEIRPTDQQIVGLVGAYRDGKTVDQLGAIFAVHTTTVTIQPAPHRRGVTGSLESVLGSRAPSMGQICDFDPNHGSQTSYKIGTNGQRPLVVGSSSALVHAWKPF